MKAIINVKGTQIVEGDENITEITSEGTFEIKDGYPVIRYTESDSDGSRVMAKLSVLDEKSFVFERRGDISTKMVIEVGTRHNCAYSTPYGELMLGICGKTLVNEIDNDGGYLKLSYTIDINSSLMSENEIEINIKPV